MIKQIWTPTHHVVYVQKLVLDQQHRKELLASLQILKQTSQVVHQRFQLYVLLIFVHYWAKFTKQIHIYESY